MKDLEEIVGEAVRDLADDAPDTFGLAAAARARGRRIRRRRHAAIGAAALTLALVAAVPFVVIRRDPGELTTTPAPSPSVTRTQAGNWWESPYQLPGGAIVTSVGSSSIDTPATLEEGDVILDRSTGRYRVLTGNYGSTVAAPVGAYSMALKATDASVLILDGKGREYDHIDTDTVMDPQWSPDGTRLLITTRKGYVLYDVATRQARTRVTPEVRRDCPQLCFFTWLPNGTEIAVGRRDPATKRVAMKNDKLQDIPIYSPETGKLLRTVPVAGIPVGADAWSPDGRTVVAYDGSELYAFADVYLFDVRTGAKLARVTERAGSGEPHFLPDGRLIVFPGLRDRTTRLYDGATGRLLEELTLPAALTNRSIGIGLPQ